MSKTAIEQIQDFVCKPIDTLDGVFVYLDSPPTWAAKCLKYRPTTRRMVRNAHTDATADCPRYFCHYSLEDEVISELFEESLLPKTLVCHDMANGYQDDSYVDGTSNHEAYNFYDWAVVDIFCYFTHHFVTIPPLAWINAAHRHGVKVLGTLITEWEDGSAKWAQILSCPEFSRKFADSLVAIAKHLSFEGWLLNVENKVERPRQLVDFVGYFSRRLHEEVPGAELLWYDSVTIAGDLSWQNALNELNVDFFRACDGIFTNYSWSEEHVRSSAALAACEGRPLDLYVGIDVWGRNFYGGGQFNTAQALEVAHKHGCSLAIFAPAWTYECVDEEEKFETIGEEPGFGLVIPKYAQFLLRERALWDTLWPYLNTKLPNELPFKSSFCRGNGKSQWRYGELISKDPWHNMAVIEYQPSANHGPHGYRLVKIAETTKTKESDDPRTEALPVLEKIKKNKNVLQMIRRVCSRKREVNRLLKNFNKLKSIEDSESQVGASKTLIPEDKNLPAGTDSRRVTPKAGAVVRYKLALVRHEMPCLRQYAQDAFNGGSCLMVEPRADRTAILLFRCDFFCKSKLIVHVVTKKLNDKEQSLIVLCTMYEGASRRRTEVTLRDFDCGPRHPESRTEFPVGATQLSGVQKYLLTDKPGEYVPIENRSDWNVRYFVLKYPGSTMTNITCRTANSSGAILLGQIGVCQMG